MIAQISPLDFAQWCQAVAPLDSATKPLLIDVREAWEVQTAAVPGNEAAPYRLVAIAMGDIAAQLGHLQAEFDADQPIACLCHHGMRSQRVAAFLVSNGFTHVVNVQGGIDAWSRQLDARVPLY